MNGKDVMSLSLSTTCIRTYLPICVTGTKISVSTGLETPGYLNLSLMAFGKLVLVWYPNYITTDQRANVFATMSFVV